AQAWIVELALRSIEAPHDPRRRLRARSGALAAAILIAGLGAVALHAFLNRMVLDARLDVGRADSGAILSPRLALQAALFLFVLCGGLLLRSLIDLALRLGSRPGDRPALRRMRGAESEGIPFALRAAGWMLLLTLT